MRVKKQLRSLLCMIFCCTVILVLMTVTVYADESGVTVNDVTVTAENQSDILENGIVSYDFETNTLSVNGCITSELTIVGNGSTDIKMQNPNSSVATNGLTISKAKNVSIENSGFSPAIYGSVEIDCTGDILISSQYIAISGKLTVTNAADVTIHVSKNNGAPAITNNTKINCSGIVNIDGGQGIAVSGILTVENAVDVSVKSACSAPTITNGMSINCTGDVSIENTAYMAVGGSDMSIVGANNVTVKSAGNVPVILVNTVSIVASGRVIIQRAGASDTPYALIGSLTFNQAGNRTYTVKMGATPENAVLVEEKAGDAQYSVSNPQAKTLVIEPVRYTVSFNVNGGTGTIQAAANTLGTYPLPTNGFTAPEGKQFKGWATTADGEIISDTSIEVTANTTLYAIWEDIPHSHSYDAKWKSDATNHWHECQCGEKADTAAHSFKWVVDQAATATEKGSKHEECEVCGYKKAAVKIPATGSYSGDSTSGSSSSDGGTTSPETGDISNMFLWAALLFVGCFGIVGTTVCSKKKEQNNFI